MYSLNWGISSTASVYDILRFCIAYLLNYFSITFFMKCNVIVWKQTLTVAAAHQMPVLPFILYLRLLSTFELILIGIIFAIMTTRFMLLGFNFL